MSLACVHVFLYVIMVPCTVHNLRKVVSMVRMLVSFVAPLNCDSTVMHCESQTSRDVLTSGRSAHHDLTRLTRTHASEAHHFRGALPPSSLPRFGGLDICFSFPVRWPRHCLSFACQFCACKHSNGTEPSPVNISSHILLPLPRKEAMNDTTD